MLNIEFIFDNDCPNVKLTRANLMKAFSKAELNAHWKEWDRNSAEAPEHAKRHGSPTILINGKDIMGVEPEAEGNCCRIYNGAGVPSVELISSKLTEGMSSSVAHNKKIFGFIGTASIGPGLGAAFLAKASCPLCYPAIAGFLSSIGLGFLFKGTYFYILMAIFLGVALFGLGYRAKSRRGFVPLYLGTFGAIVAMVFHYFKNDYVFFFGIGVLIIASVWNLIPARKHCDACN